MKPVYCTLCGEELTAPQFYKGEPYGWSCVRKVNPRHRKVALIPFSEYTIKRAVIGQPDKFRAIVIHEGCKWLVVGLPIDGVLWVNPVQFSKR